MLQHKCLDRRCGDVVQQYGFLHKAGIERRLLANSFSSRRATQGPAALTTALGMDDLLSDAIHDIFRVTIPMRFPSSRDTFGIRADISARARQLAAH